MLLSLLESFRVFGMPSVNVVISDHGKPLFEVDRYVYEVENKNGPNVFYCRCVRKRTKGCPARATIEKVTNS